MELLTILLVVLFIIIATVKFKLNPVFSLILAALISGFLLGLTPQQMMVQIGEGFGKTLSGIGLVIAFGSVIGIFLERRFLRKPSPIFAERSHGELGQTGRRASSAGVAQHETYQQLKSLSDLVSRFSRHVGGALYAAHVLKRCVLIVLHRPGCAFRKQQSRIKKYDE